MTREPPDGRVPGPRLPLYRADLPFTYAYGRFAVLEALTHLPHAVRQVILHGDLPSDERVRIEAACAASGAGSGAPCVRDDATVERLRRNATVRCLAVVEKVEQRLSPGADHVALAHPSHFGNVGSAIRSLLAFGITDLALVDPAYADDAPRSDVDGSSAPRATRAAVVDPWSPHVVRASVGLRFALRCQTFASPDAYAERFPDRRAYVFDASAATPLDAVRFQRPFTLWFGPEWPGRAGERADGPRAGAVTHVRIPQDGRVESLNLAVAVSIAVYRARQRSVER